MRFLPVLLIILFFPVCLFCQEKLKSENPVERRKAAYDLGVKYAGAEDSQEKQKAVDALKKALKDKNAQVRRFAGKSLEMIQREQALPVLRKSFEKEVDRGVKVGFARILGNYRDERNKEVLHGLLDDNDPVVRTEAVYSLGRLGFDDSREKIAEMLNDKAEGVKAAACEVTASLKIEQAAGGIIGVLSDSNAELRLKAAEALLVLAKSDHKEVLEKYRKNEKDEKVKNILDEIIKGLAKK